MSNDLFLNRCVSSGSLSLSMSLVICLFLFCFVRLFLRLSFIQILDLVVLSYGITLRVPFTFERFCGSLFLGLSPLGPLYCRSFTPFLCFLWLLSLLVASFFCSLLCHVRRRRAPFFSVRLFRGFLFLFLFFLGRIPRSSFLYWFSSQQFAALGSIHFLAFSARACSLAFLCLAILFLGICRAVF